MDDPSDSESGSSVYEHAPEPAPSPIVLKDIPTLRQLYAKSILRAPAADRVRYPSQSTLLDRISLFQGDITKLGVDSIVNAANKSLLGGGGVDGAIHAAAGIRLLEECSTLNGCETGNSKITKGYNLPSLHVIHTVGPIYSSRDAETKAAQLESCYETSLALAANNGLKHIAFPSISTGIYGYPIEDATHIALDVVRRFLDGDASASTSTDEQPDAASTSETTESEKDKQQLERVIFVVWSDKDKGVYEELLPEYFPPEDETGS